TVSAPTGGAVTSTVGTLTGVCACAAPADKVRTTSDGKCGRSRTSFLSMIIPRRLNAETRTATAAAASDSDQGWRRSRLGGEVTNAGRFIRPAGERRHV